MIELNSRSTDDEGLTHRVRNLARRGNTLWVATILAAAGGFLDAFTYFGHGQVFANAMTGNVVLFGIFATTDDFVGSLHYLYPIVFFLLGVFAAQILVRPRTRYLFPFPDPVIASLTAEMAFLFAAGWCPPNFQDPPIVCGISFVAALQNCTFPRVENWAYSSVMTTGNLRQFAECIFRILFARSEPATGRQARLFGTICVAFLGGAILGGLCTRWIHNKALWVVDFLLLFAWIPIIVASRFPRSTV
jgi:uncharacterized membrane protein YoaK (UPF0700 family)